MLKINGNSLQAVLIDRKMTPCELAKRAGVGERLVTSLLNHKIERCRYRTVYQIARALNVEPATIVNLERTED